MPALVAVVEVTMFPNHCSGLGRSLLAKTVVTGAGAPEYPMLVGGGGVGVEPDGRTGELHGTLLLRMFGEVGGLLPGSTPLLPVHGCVMVPATVLPSLLLLLLLYFTVSEEAADGTLPLEVDAGSVCVLPGVENNCFATVFADDFALDVVVTCRGVSVRKSSLDDRSDSP